MANSENPIVIVQTTVDDESKAYELARTAVEDRLSPPGPTWTHA
ncbi:hypothetical protein ACFV7Q_36665 [Streptomyces sp. NPDC059851]